MAKAPPSELVSNRKAFHEYAILETYEAGIKLVGTEVKSLRDHGGSLQDAYILVNAQNEVILKNASIAAYKFGNINNHEEKRDRILLVHKREIRSLKNHAQEKGFTLIPLSMYLSKGFVKVKIGIAKGKSTYDKRQDLKTKEHKKTIDRAMKGRDE
ncbi:MAG: SsrA-binding protein SmpB [Chlamydiae bacterium]|nr:SsrA-binding protein SmpB [Chlamydiota bacterium]